MPVHEYAVTHKSDIPRPPSVPHVTGDGLKNDRVQLFVKEFDGTPPGEEPKPVLMLHGRSVPADPTFDLCIPQFVHWESANPNGAIGKLHGQDVTLSGPMGTAFYFNDNYPNFGTAAFTPQLAATGMVEIVGGMEIVGGTKVPHGFTLSFGVPIENPILHLGSLASTLTFPAGTAVTKLSGDASLVVAGNEVTGQLAHPMVVGDTLGPNDSNGSIQLTGTFSSITFTLEPNFGDHNIPDGVFLQVGEDGTSYSWARYLQNSGFDVFIMDLEGLGRSQRPAVMDEACNASSTPTPPVPGDDQNSLIPNPLESRCPVKYPYKLSNTDSDQAAVRTIVNFIQRTRNVQKVALVGYSAGAAVLGPFAMNYHQDVSSLLLCAPVFLPDVTAVSAPPPNTLPTAGVPLDIYTREDTFHDWDTETSDGAPRDKTPNFLDNVWQAIIDTDPLLGRNWGGKDPNQPDGVIRAPFPEQPRWGWNKLALNTDSKLGSNNLPVLIIDAALDKTANSDAVPPPPAPPIKPRLSVRELYDAIKGTRKIIVTVSSAGHFIPWQEKRKTLHAISEIWLRTQKYLNQTAGEFTA